MCDTDEAITVKQACRILGGDEAPIAPCTYYRGVKAGRYPAPGHIVRPKYRPRFKECRAGYSRSCLERRWPFQWGGSITYALLKC